MNDMRWIFFLFWPYSPICLLFTTPQPVAFAGEFSSGSNFHLKEKKFNKMNREGHLCSIELVSSSEQSLQVANPLDFNHNNRNPCGRLLKKFSYSEHVKLARSSVLFLPWSLFILLHMKIPSTCNLQR